MVKLPGTIRRTAHKPALNTLRARRAKPEKDRLIFMPLGTFRQRHLELPQSLGPEDGPKPLPPHPALA